MKKEQAKIDWNFFLVGTNNCKEASHCALGCKMSQTKLYNVSQGFSFLSFFSFFFFFFPVFFILFYYFLFRNKKSWNEKFSRLRIPWYNLTETDCLTVEFLDMIVGLLLLHTRRHTTIHTRKCWKILPSHTVREISIRQKQNQQCVEWFMRRCYVQKLMFVDVKAYATIIYDASLFSKEYYYCKLAAVALNAHRVLQSYTPTFGFKSDNQYWNCSC